MRRLDAWPLYTGKHGPRCSSLQSGSCRVRICGTIRLEYPHMCGLCRRQWDRWFMMGSIGITVGIIGYFLFFIIELLSDLKYRAVR